MKTEPQKKFGESCFCGVEAHEHGFGRRCIGWTEQTDIVSEARELLANAASGPLTLIRYEHGGGRLYREEPRDLIADFYDAGNRELYYRAPELLRQLADEVERLRRLTQQGEKSDVFSDEYAALGHDEKDTSNHD